MRTVCYSIGSGVVEGSYAPGFERVFEAFKQNFEQLGEIGGSVCLIKDGLTVVDLWGGMASRSEPWHRNTLTTVFSCTKAAAALCAHLLIERNQLRLDDAVAQHWPEFAANGKGEITVRMLLNHSAGLPAVRDPVKSDGSLDWFYMADRLANEEPFWPPGAAVGYHMITFGWTVGELVRRVSGSSIGDFFRREFAEPLGAQFWIGLPPELNDQVAKTISFSPDKNRAVSEYLKQVMSPESIPHLALLNTGGWDPNTDASRAAQIPAANGISNARGLATIFSPAACRGSIGGRQYLAASTVATMAQESSRTDSDRTLCLPTRFALGFMKAMDNRTAPDGDRDSALWGESGFGHVGAGGSLVLADPDHGFSFGYAMNKMGEGLLLNQRGQNLVDACYNSITGSLPY